MQLYCGIIVQIHPPQIMAAHRHSGTENATRLPLKCKLKSKACHESVHVYGVTSLKELSILWQKTMANEKTP